MARLTEMQARKDTQEFVRLHGRGGEQRGSEARAAVGAGGAADKQAHAPPP